MKDITKQQTEQIEELLSKMSIEEKIAQLTGIGLHKLIEENQTLSHDKMAELLSNGIGQITLSGGATNLPPEKTAENANAVQQFLAEKTRLGIPAIVNDECIAGFVCMGATHFPQAIGMGAAWNPELSKKMAFIIGQQARAAGSHLMYSPVFDIGVDPRWGRIEETWGEDPYLASRIGVAFVQGLHGKTFHEGVISTLKHFAGYSSTEGGRNCAPAHIGPRELREIFLLPFEAAVKEGNAQSVMAAYHDIDGIPCAADRRLLTDILRGEWGFKGIVIADWGVVEMLYTSHKTAENAAEASKQALSAGLDVETPNNKCYINLIDIVKQGKFPEEIVDQSVRRHLRIKMMLGLFDNPYVPADRTSKIFDMPEHRKIALEAARNSMTLLKNDDNLLPLNKNIKSIAVIGPNANNTHRLLGDYSYSVYKRLEGDAVKIVSILEGIKNKVASKTNVLYAQGCHVMDSSTDGFADAVQTVEKADVIIAVMGGCSALHKNGTSGENIDRAELNLPGAQEELLKELHKIGKPIVLVLTNGRPLAIEWTAKNIPAIVEAWLPGEEGGNAVADVLFGDYNPGGKLPVSMLCTGGQAPTTYNIRSTSFVKSAHYAFTDRQPLFPFGHGLSYTEFSYNNLKINLPIVNKEEDIRISCEVENTGKCTGDEVIQLYIHDLVASVTRPKKELKGFKRITLKPGQKNKLTFVMPIELLSFYDTDMNLVVEPGVFEIMIGSSSEDIRLKDTFELTEKREIDQRRCFCTEVEIEKSNVKAKN